MNVDGRIKYNTDGRIKEKREETKIDG